MTDRASTELLLDIQDLRASYGAVEVLRGIDFTVAKGEIVALLGTNGAGKSTILRCISGLLAPDSGALMLLGANALSGMPSRTSSPTVVRLPSAPSSTFLLPNVFLTLMPMMVRRS